MTKLIELLFLRQIKGFGKVKSNKYLDAVRTKNITELQELLLQQGMATKEDLDAARINAEAKYKAFISQSDLKIVTVLDPEYPNGFFDLNNQKPLILYAKGNVSVLNQPGISVVGSRKPSMWTRKFGENVSKQMGVLTGRIIVSGLALGCDSLAHKGALAAHVPTVAILPSGVNVITPPSHKELAQDIINNGGCIVSEYEPDAAAFRTTFIERDRLIAAMTDITYVIECDEKSGTMHTVNAAYDLGRQLSCYYPSEDDIHMGADVRNYQGNKLMIDKMAARIVSRQEELQAYFEAINTREEDNKPEKNHQMTIDEFIGNDNS